MGLINNVFTGITGLSMGKLINVALTPLVGKEIAGMIGALKDISSGNYVGAFQNGRQALEALQGGRAGQANSVERPSGFFGTLGKVAGWAAAAVVAGPALLAGGALLSTVAGGLNGSMMRIAAGAAALGIGGLAAAGGGGGLGGLLNQFGGMGAEGNVRGFLGPDASRTRGGVGSRVGSLPPGSSFERLLSAAMMDAAKDQEEKIKGYIDRLRKMDQEDGKSAGASAGGGLSGFVRSIPVIGGLLGGVLPGGADGSAGKGQDSRATLMEEMKFEVQQYTQMMSAISNILNTMHDTATQTIRKIGG